jgi:hypothetical protein
MNTTTQVELSLDELDDIFIDLGLSEPTPAVPEPTPETQVIIPTDESQDNIADDPVAEAELIAETQVIIKPTVNHKWYTYLNKTDVDISQVLEHMRILCQVKASSSEMNIHADSTTSRTLTNIQHFSRVKISPLMK